MSILRDLHTKLENGEGGYVHHDIKPDNILIKSGDLTHYESSLLQLIDFSVTCSVKNNFAKLNDSSSKAIEKLQSVQSLEDEFNGNLVFASLY